MSYGYFAATDEHVDEFLAVIGRPNSVLTPHQFASMVQIGFIIASVCATKAYMPQAYVDCCVPLKVSSGLMRKYVAGVAVPSYHRYEGIRAAVHQHLVAAVGEYRRQTRNPGAAPVAPSGNLN